MNKKDLIVWIGLLILTLSSYFSAESALGKRALVFVLLGITAIKFFSVGFQFMELKKAHRFWKISFVSIFLIFATLVVLLTKN